VVGDWLEGLVTFYVLNRGLEEFKAGGDLEGAAMECDPPSRNSPYGAECDRKSEATGGSSEWPKRPAVL
jgi:hypothetical protein